MSDCESVHVLSSSTLTANDDVMINDMHYQSGSRINLIVPTNFTISMTSVALSSNTSLHWNCAQWGEWSSETDGTCRYVKRPIHNGTMTRNLVKYKLNDTCSKFRSVVSDTF